MFFNTVRIYIYTFIDLNVTVEDLVRQEDFHRKVSNAAILSKASYKPDEKRCLAFLNNDMGEKHELRDLTVTQFGKNRILIAREKGNSKRVYISFRGTHDVSHWKETNIRYRKKLNF